MKAKEPDPVTRSKTQAAVHAPHWELASCVRAYVTRSTIGAQLTPAERHSFYPATLGCSISWTLQGQTALVRIGDQICEALAPSPVMFTGPHTLPCETRNPGPVQFFLLMLMPDAFHALTGLDLQALTNQHFPVHALLDADWQAMADQVAAAPDDATRIRLIEDFLSPRWRAMRPSGWLRMPQALSDWSQNLAMRYVTSSTGKSLRQMERRIKQWTGQTQRQLHRLMRFEAAYLLARTSHQQGDLSWSDFAADQGYSDQSHFCREFRKLTGLRPEDVMRRLETDERLWLFKAWA